MDCMKLAIHFPPNHWNVQQDNQSESHSLLDSSSQVDNDMLSSLPKTFVSFQTMPEMGIIDKTDWFPVKTILISW